MHYLIGLLSLAMSFLDDCDHLDDDDFLLPKDRNN